MPLKAILTIPTSPIQLPKTPHRKPRNRHSPSTIMLQYLIRSPKRTSANYLRRSPSILVLNRERVFADRRPPDVGECASALAMDTFDLVGADDYVRDGSPGFELEDCVGITAFGLSCARHAAIEHYHAAVERGAGCDCLCGRED
jgi:hypothetical protein